MRPETRTKLIATVVGAVLLAVGASAWPPALDEWAPMLSAACLAAGTALQTWVWARRPGDAAISDAGEPGEAVPLSQRRIK